MSILTGCLQSRLRRQCVTVWVIMHSGQSKKGPDRKRIPTSDHSSEMALCPCCKDSSSPLTVQKIQREVTSRIQMAPKLV